MSEPRPTPPTAAFSSPNVDHFEDVFSRHIVEIEQVWEQLNVSRATNAKVFRSKRPPHHLRMRYPIKLSAIQALSNMELQNMRDNDEGEDGEVAESISKEAGVLLSFLGAMFVENLTIKTMYHRPHHLAFGFQRNETLPTPPQSSSSTDPTVTPELNVSSLFNTSVTLEPVDMILTREDVRRALLREEQFDFLVQSGHAQPDIESPVNTVGDAESQASIASERNSDTIHLGYWKIIERTFSALEQAQVPSTQLTPTKTMSHRPEELRSKVLMTLNPETDPSHRRLTIFPDNEDLEHQSVEFVLTKLEQHQDKALTKARINGKLQLGHLTLSSLEGHDVDIFANIPSTDGDDDVSSRLLPPMNFDWSVQNEFDPNFPLIGRPSPGNGHGSVQLLDPTSAYTMFGSMWLKECSWGVMSLDLVFSLGDTGFNLHNHYLGIPIFVQPPLGDC